MLSYLQSYFRDKYFSLFRGFLAAGIYIFTHYINLYKCKWCKESVCESEREEERERERENVIYDLRAVENDYSEYYTVFNILVPRDKILHTYEQIYGTTSPSTSINIQENAHKMIWSNMRVVLICIKLFTLIFLCSFPFVNGKNITEYEGLLSISQARICHLME